MKLQLFFDNFAYLLDATNGVAKLRELFLQLAVEGKLVAHVIGAEPASVLLARIRKDKDELKRRRNGNKGVPEETRIESVPFVIPKHWELVSLEEITDDVHYGYTAAANHALTNVRLLRITDIQNGKVDWASVPGCEIDQDKLEAFKLGNNDILIARTGGTIGKSYLVEDLDLIAVFASYLIRVVPNKNIDPKYLKLFLESPFYWNQLYEKSMGTGQPNVNATSLKSVALPLPPFEEQKRIVSKLKELMELCDKLNVHQKAKRENRINLNNTALAALSKPATLSSEEFERATAGVAEHFDTLYESVETVAKLRSTILQLAVHGKLVAQDPKDQSANDLITKIKRNRGEVTDAKILKVEQSRSLETEMMAFPAPVGWKWTRLAELCKLITKGSSPKWQGVSYVTEGEGILFVTSENVGSYRMSYDNRKFVEQRFNDIEPRSILRRNDLLMNIVGASIGRTALFDSDEVANINQAVCLIRVIDDSLVPYLLHFLNSEACIQMMFDKQVENARANLSMGNIANFPVPLPPLAEQKRIVTKVNHLMALCDDLEAKLQQVETHSEKLMNAAVQHVLQTLSSASRVNDVLNVANS